MASEATAATGPWARDAAVATLYVIPGSHACRTGMLLLEHKRIPYRLIELPAGLHPQIVRLCGFPGSREPKRMVDGGPTRMSALMDRFGTVPAVQLGGARVQGNMEIARHLERTQPAPPLFPADPQMRAAVEAAAAWGDEPLQMLARRLALAAGLDRLADRGGSGRLGALLARSELQRGLLAGIAGRTTFKTGGEAEARLRGELPSMLDRVDGWTAEGVLNGEHLWVADYLIAPSLAL
ncbi:MAG: glutathione S-transferase N-terminal domain-containing protein, partial [Solirubrobacteraceae bacterium]